MAPRKRADKSVQNIGEKVNKRGRQKIIHGNVPSIIRVEIPTSSSSTTGMKTSKARVVTSQKLKAPSASSNKISKPRVVTKPNLSKNEIKIMLANEVAQAQFPKKSMINECNHTELPMKRKITPKKMMDGRIPSIKKMKSVTITTMDSDGSAFKESTEPKQQKKKTKAQRKNVDRPCRTDVDVTQNGAVKRRRAFNSETNKTNPKTKSKVTRNCKMNAQGKSKTRKKNEKPKKEVVTDGCNNEESVLNGNGNEGNSENLEEVRFRKPSNASECLSWTKDISSSSTTSCVTVSTNDYVWLDNRVPMVKLTNICNQSEPENVGEKNNESTLDFKSTDYNTNVQKLHEDRSVSPTPSKCRSLSLSSSSSSSSSDSDSSSDQNRVTAKRDDPLDETLDKLETNLKKFDAEIMKWIGYGNEKRNSTKINFEAKVSDVLKEEGEVISICRNIKKLLLNNDHQYVFASFEKDTSDKNERCEDFVKPDIAADLKSDKEINSNVAVFKDINGEKEMKNDVGDIRSFDDRCNDDDDALSLYAESISGFDSFRKSTCVSNEEYIPQPVSETAQPNQSVNYMPTKITDWKSHEKIEFLEPHQRTNSICEKQNADSTSIYKDPQYLNSQLLKCSDESTASGETCEQSFRNLFSVSTPVRLKKPTLMSSMYEDINCVKSVVFGGVCFFNLILSCKKAKCRFLHVPLDFNVIKLRLTEVSEEMFIKEYMLIRNWAVLRRKFGLLFVSEAIIRELTRIAIEMAMDFVTKASPNLKEDVTLKVEVLEQVLLYLNKVDISPFSALLLMNIKNEECICDMFMLTLAETQNFSRFKTIFVNLANFMFKNNRQFNLHVASLLLERVSILPFDETLILAVLNILRRTSPDILENSMIPHFEKLLSSHQDLFNKLQEIKNMIPSQFYTALTPTANHYDLDQTSSKMLGELDKRCSPDTTNFNHLTKTRKDSIIPPAIDSNRAWLFDQSRGLINESHISPAPSQNNGIEQRKKFKNWRKRSIFNKIVMVANNNAGTSRRPNFKHHKYQREQYEGSPSAYPRRFGPEFL